MPHKLKPVQTHYLPEAACWVMGLYLLAWMEPTERHLFSLCPLSWMLEDGCPGCGLGHAMSFLFRGELAASWKAHPFGIPAVLMLLHRIYSLLKNYLLLRFPQHK